MTNHASAKKRNRQRIKRTARNRAVRTSVRSTIKKARCAIDSSADDAAALVRSAQSELDRAAQKGILPRRRAARLKGRLAVALHRSGDDVVETAYHPREIAWLAEAPTRIPVDSLGNPPSAEVAHEFAREHLVVLFDDEFSLGSGVLVVLSNGARAILTARHVVVDLVVAGAVHCVVPHFGWSSIQPSLLRVEARADLALVHLPPDFAAVGGLAWAEWSPDAATTLEGRVLVAGTPGEWNGEIEDRRMSGLRGMGLWATVSTDDPYLGLIALDVDVVERLPSRFGGVSGGPVVTPTGKLVGIATGESPSGRRRIHCAPLGSNRGLVEAYRPPAGAPEDFAGQVSAQLFPVQYKDFRRVNGVFYVVGVFEDFWSVSASEGPHGRISRLIALACAREDSSRFVMNTEAVFHPESKTLTEHMKQRDLEVSLLLGSPHVEVLEASKAPIAPREAVEFMTYLLELFAPRSSSITLFDPREVDLDAQPAPGAIIGDPSEVE